MIINWKQNRVLILTAKTGNGGAITIVPGINVIPDDVWKELAVDLKARIGKDIIEVKAEKKSKEGKDLGLTNVKSPSEMEPKEAEALLVDTFSIPVLKEWLDNESRDGVRAAIYRRITELEEATKPK
jgi:hypothetical protein